DQILIFENDQIFKSIKKIIKNNTQKVNHDDQIK
ncbi:MAG: hypothetical protein RIR48_731, partial [Bacteroidota bacterium]